MRKLLFLPFLCLTITLSAQSLSQDYLNYIETFKQAAVEQEIKHHIPACITLAQGLLESGAGKSDLAVKANNHFGIKCHKDWTGGTFHKDDDAKDECFRAYDDPAESYNDHSLFLKRPRYESLFLLDIKDYKGWAKGLRECGYATDPSYASKLIKIIDEYSLVAICETELYSAASKAAKAQVEEERSAAPADGSTSRNTTKKRKPADAAIVEEAFATASGTVDPEVNLKGKKEKRISSTQVASVDLYQGHEVYRHGLKKYVIAQAGDTYAGIAAEFNIELRRIARYNNLSEHQTPRKGEKVFLTGKNTAKKKR